MFRVPNTNSAKCPLRSPGLLVACSTMAISAPPKLARWFKAYWWCGFDATVVDRPVRTLLNFAGGYEFKAMLDIVFTSTRSA